MQTFETRTIGDIAISSPAAARVFEEFKIDYCCGGQMSFAEACSDAGVEPSIVEKKLIELMEVDANSDLESVSGLTLTELTDYIIKRHHGYARKELAHLEELGRAVEDEHGERHPQLSEVRRVLKLIHDDLMPHMMKEEIVLFPYIAELEAHVVQGVGRRKPHFGSVCNPIGMMSTEHQRVAGLLGKLRAATGDYQVPSDACLKYSSYYAGLADLERDLHQHIHLENNLLFVKAVLLDEEADRLSA